MLVSRKKNIKNSFSYERKKQKISFKVELNQNKSNQIKALRDNTSKGVEKYKNLKTKRESGWLSIDVTPSIDGKISLIDEE